MKGQILENIKSGKRPNFLIIMSDEHAPMFSNTYGNPAIKTPNMDRLAEQGSTFDSAYCNAPLCIPSRAAFMTGQYVSKCKVWDNASAIPPDAMTCPYLLGSQGYDVVLSGKMHLIGPDNLHGFNRQLGYEPHGGVYTQAESRGTTGPQYDGKHAIYSWDDPMPEADTPWQSVIDAGAGRTSMIDADDAFESAALSYLNSRNQDNDQPFALCIGFTAPHFPFVVPEPYFSMYYPEKADMPNNPPGHLENLPAAADRLINTFGLKGYTDEQIMRARAAYYGLVTYLDDKIGRLLDALENNGLAENTVVIHTSDHGESLGEHGLWRKMNFYEQSARVPLQISWPNILNGNQRFSGTTSLVDVTATILDIAGIPKTQLDFWKMDGNSLLPMINGQESNWKDEAFVEHLAHGTDRPRSMIRNGNYKLSYGHGDPPEFELYDLAADPGEFKNLALDPQYEDIKQKLLDRIMDIWGDPEELNLQIKASQVARISIREQIGDEALF